MSNNGAIFLFICAMGIAGCADGGSSGGSNSAAAQPNLSIELRDGSASSDQIDRFEVDLTSVELIRSNGKRVETLPASTRVDLAELLDVAELLISSYVPNGKYRGMSLTVDFSDASVHIAGKDADADVLDEDGDPLTGTRTLELEFEKGRKLDIKKAPDPRIVTVDFDLDESVSVDEDSNSVRVFPFLVADFDVEHAHHRKRVSGYLDGVDLDEHRFTLEVHPFRHHHRHHHHGHARVSIDEETVFEIDGLLFVGQAGLEEMAEAGPTLKVIAIGKKRPHHRFLADEVIAGTSVDGGDRDSLVGVVLAREGDTLTVATKKHHRAHGPKMHEQVLDLVLDESTIVTRQGSDAEFDIDSISVGQQIFAIGSFEEKTDCFTFESVAHVRQLRTDLSGYAVSESDGGLIMDVHRFGSQRAECFDFTGTGEDGDDAKPWAYRIDISTLEFTPLAGGERIRAFGFVTPFGSAPPDFDAVSLVLPKEK